MNKKVVFSSLLWRFGERISAQLVTFIVSILIARILSPADYGAIAIIMVFINIANILVFNGFATALIQKKDTDDVDFSSVFIFSFGLSLLLYFVLFLAAPLIASWYDDMDILCPTLRVLGIRIIIGSINSVQHAYISRRMEFKKFFFSTLGGTILSGIVGIIMAYSGFGIWALIAQYLVNILTDTIVLWFTVQWRPKCLYSWKRLKILISFGWKLLFSALLGAVYDDLRTLIIGKVYTRDDLAFYSRGQQFPSLIMNNVNISVSSVFFPVLSSLQDKPATLAEENRKLIQVLCGALSPIMFGLAAVGFPLVKILLRDRWLDCVPFLQICCIFYLITAIYNAYLQSFKAIGRSDLTLIMETIDYSTGILLVICFFRISVMTIAIVTVVSRLIACIITIFLYTRVFKQKIIYQLIDISLPIIISGLMFVIVTYTGNVFDNVLVSLLLQILVGVLCYSILAYFVKLPISSFVLNKLRHKNHA